MINKLHNRLKYQLWAFNWIRKLHRIVHGREYKSDFEAIPGMTTLEERNYYYKISRELKGKGQIVDLGCWMGSTTIPMLKGLSENQNALKNGVRVHAFDTFIWDEYMERDFPRLSNKLSLKLGDDFAEQFNLLTKEYTSILSVHKGDLNNYSWQSDDIELLLIDAMKSENLTISIAKSFFPSVLEILFIIKPSSNT